MLILNKIQEYFPDSFEREQLAANQLASFDALWTLDAGWFEVPNERRGGWSGVSRYVLANGDAIFIKRQKNHVYRSWQNLFLPVATFEREFKNILHFQKLAIPTMTLVYFGQRRINGDLQSILITRELKDFQALDAEDYQPINKLSQSSRKSVIQAAANAIRHMHDCKIQHNCLYLKHVFIKIVDDRQVDVRFIDLEKAKWRPWKNLAMFRDLASLLRHAEGWSKTDCLRFFLCYNQQRRLSKASKQSLTNILQQIEHKNNHGK
ncbi:MAG: inaA protein [Bacteroidia bacterium]|nr:inaA protein [Methylotenera sp.]